LHLLSAIAASALALASTAATAPNADSRVRQLLRDAGARGAIVVLDVPTGRLVASAGNARDVAAPVLPLSVIKLYIAAIWWDRELGDVSFGPPGALRATVSDVVSHGYDAPGAEMAVELRRRFGGAAVLEALKHYGLGSVTLDPAAEDATWGSALSIGEHGVRVTLLEVAQFVRAIGAGGGDLLRPEVAESLQAAMLRAGETGTARIAAARLAGTHWKLAGKTGTGPNVVGPTSDGWFAGLLFENAQPRYAVAVYVDARGPGGGVAASLAADLPKLLAR
jgi:hypothetical protein